MSRCLKPEADRNPGVLRARNMRANCAPVSTEEAKAKPRRRTVFLRAASQARCRAATCAQGALMSGREVPKARGRKSAAQRFRGRFSAVGVLGLLLAGCHQAARPPAHKPANDSTEAGEVSAVTRPTEAYAASQPAEDDARMLVFGVNRVGNPAPLYNPAGYDEALYQRIREAGGTCVRLTASPRDIEAERGKRDWREFDRDVALALKYGQEPIVCIVNTPAWASPDDQPTHLHPYRTELLPEFGDFCTDLARRTKGKVKYFQLWNEQNGCGWYFFEGFNRADEYLPVLKVCYDALKKGNPDCILSMGSLDDAEGHAPIFVRKIYEEQKKQNISGPLFDVISDHPYSDTPQIMRAKLDALRWLLKANGDGDKPFWLTEYGWHTGNTPPAEQASRLAAVLEAFISPGWSDVQAAVYLCIADFENHATGFGLVDTNLRPRPSFHAFQGASRFGAYPPCEIKADFSAADRLVITWRTLQPTRGKVMLQGPDSSTAVTRTVTEPATEQRAEFDGIQPDKVYRYSIETVCERGGRAKSIKSADYEIRSPGPAVFNGDFDEGFFAGIAKGWRIDGEGFCTDAALIPLTHLVYGKHAQVVYAAGERGHAALDSTLSTLVAVERGQEVRISVSWFGNATADSVKVLSRLGIGPEGQSQPGAVGVQWSSWEETPRFWDDASLSAKAANSVIRVFVQCRSEGSLEKATATFMLDNVRIEAE